jgi:hypothetical protein
MRRILLIITFHLFIQFISFSQVERDQDLITLKNGYQYLGYIIEQQPGKLIKLYRAQENDTISIPLLEVAKLSKIWVKPFSEKKFEPEEKDTVIDIGRFNNKRNVFQIGLMLQFRDIEARERRGVFLGWQRNFENRYRLGLSALIFGRQNTELRYGNSILTSQQHELVQYHLLASGSVRLGRRPQNRRLSTWLNVNGGYIFDGSTSRYATATSGWATRYEEANDCWTLQAALSFRVNPDTQSGFALEPGYGFYAQSFELYNSEPSAIPSIFIGTRRETVHLFTLKMSYFF